MARSECGPLGLALFLRKLSGHERHLNPQSKTTKGRPEATLSLFFPEEEIGAGDEIRTHDPNLGKVMLYP